MTTQESRDPNREDGVVLIGMFGLSGAVQSCILELCERTKDISDMITDAKSKRDSAQLVKVLRATGEALNLAAGRLGFDLARSILRRSIIARNERVCIDPQVPTMLRFCGYLEDGDPPSNVGVWIKEKLVKTMGDLSRHCREAPDDAALREACSLTIRKATEAVFKAIFDLEHDPKGNVRRPATAVAPLHQSA